MPPLARWTRCNDDAEDDACPALANEGRAAVIHSRLRALTGLWGGLTLSLAALDLIGFPQRVAVPLALCRILASVILVFAVSFLSRRSTLHHAHRAGVCSYAIPVVQCMISYIALCDWPATWGASALPELYWILPVISMATIGILPLRAREYVLFASPALLSALTLSAVEFGVFNLGPHLEALLLVPPTLAAMLACIGRGVIESRAKARRS